MNILTHLNNQKHRKSRRKIKKKKGKNFRSEQTFFVMDEASAAPVTTRRARNRGNPIIKCIPNTVESRILTSNENKWSARLELKGHWQERAMFPSSSAATAVQSRRPRWREDELDNQKRKPAVWSGIYQWVRRDQLCESMNGLNRILTRLLSDILDQKLFAEKSSHLHLIF